MKQYIIVIASLLFSCSSTPEPVTTALDPHAGHDHATTEVDHSQETHTQDDHTQDTHSPDEHTEAEHTEPTTPAQGVASEEIVFTPAQALAVGLTTEKVVAAPFEAVIKCAGQIIGAQGDVATIVAPTNGVVSLAATTLAPGRAVKAGETLAYVSSAMISGGDQAGKLKASYTTALNEWQRATKLVADKIISQKEYEQITLQYKTAKIEYDALVGASSTRGINAQSPLSGYITELLVGNGQHVAAGDPIAVVAKNQTMELRADVPAKYIGQLAKIRSANFTTTDEKTYSLKEMNGRMLSFARSTVSSSPYLPVTFSFDNRGNIAGGSFVEVFLLLNASEQTISVPVSAIVENQETFNVFIQLDQECYEKRIVQLGANNGERVEIKSGLKVGETVVTRGAYQVRMAASSGAIPDGHNH